MPEIQRKNRRRTSIAAAPKGFPAGSRVFAVVGPLGHVSLGCCGPRTPATPLNLAFGALPSLGKQGHFNMNAKEVEQQYHQAVADQQYTNALALATQYFNVFPRHAQRVVYFWRMNMACRLEDGTQALEVLREAVAAGHWFTKLDENPTFANLKEFPEFQSLVALCAQRRAEEMANAPSIVKTLRPEHGRDPYPLVIALHGNSGNVEAFAPHWRTAVKHGWLVSLPQSPQAVAPNLVD